MKKFALVFIVIILFIFLVSEVLEIDLIGYFEKGDPIGKTFPEWIEENTEKTETLIIGGGMAGCSTAFALAEKKVSSILVERGSSLAPPTASSNGDSRMYRKMY